MKIEDSGSRSLTERIASFGSFADRLRFGARSFRGQLLLLARVEIHTKDLSFFVAVVLRVEQVVAGEGQGIPGDAARRSKVTALASCGSSVGVTQTFSTPSRGRRRRGGVCRQG